MNIPITAAVTLPIEPNDTVPLFSSLFSLFEEYFLLDLKYSDKFTQF